MSRPPLSLTTFASTHIFCHQNVTFRHSTEKGRQKRCGHYPYQELKPMRLKTPVYKLCSRRSDITKEFAASPLSTSKLAFHWKDRTRHARIGRAENVPSKACQCLTWCVSSHAPAFSERVARPNRRSPTNYDSKDHPHSACSTHQIGRAHV